MEVVLDQTRDQLLETDKMVVLVEVVVEMLLLEQLVQVTHLQQVHLKETMVLLEAVLVPIMVLAQAVVQEQLAEHLQVVLEETVVMVLQIQ